MTFAIPSSHGYMVALGYCRADVLSLALGRPLSALGLCGSDPAGEEAFRPMLHRLLQYMNFGYEKCVSWLYSLFVAFPIVPIHLRENWKGQLFQ